MSRLRLNPIWLGGGCQIDPPMPKNLLISRWLKLRLCDLMNFTGNIEGYLKNYLSWGNLKIGVF